MNKTFKAFLVMVLMSAITAMAVDYQYSKVTTVSTNNATLVTNTIRVGSGYLEGIYIDSTAGTTADVDIAYSYSPFGTKITIASINKSAPNAYYPVRVRACDSSGVATGYSNELARVPLFGGTIDVMVHNANTAAMTNYVYAIWGP